MLFVMILNYQDQLQEEHNWDFSLQEQYNESLQKTTFHDISCPICKTSIEGSHAVLTNPIASAIVETGINTVCSLTWVFGPVCKAIIKTTLKKYQDVQMNTEMATDVCRKVFLCNSSSSEY